MIEINIDPTIVTVGHFALRWFSLLALASVAVGILWGSRQMRKQGMSADPLFTILLWAIPGGIVGSRLVHVIDQWEYYAASPAAIFGGAGQAIYGAILGGTLAAWIGAKVHRIPHFSRLADIIAPIIPLSHSIGRLADVITGDAMGALASGPWAFVYTNPNTLAPIGVPVHPSPAYEILWNLVVFVILFRLRGRLEPPGSLMLLYLALYSLARFFINFTRESDPFLLGLHQAQVISLIVLAVTVPILVARTRMLPVGADGGRRR